MKDTIKYVGLDVSKEKIAVVIADEGRDEPRYWGMIPNTVESIRKLVKGSCRQKYGYYTLRHFLEEKTRFSLR
ncbi:hypothetical protein NDK43_11895 [Neobacillus pocheonensis]|uniref:IS110 family transposase n=1 Tax=Neobacillus pocheonensis TaxID=363869 RepID=A0ABT0WBQ9_9BACI|nr:hypothetical protein [Neobacillus pocheonensis]